MRKKVLFITNTLCQGGAEHSLVTTLGHIDVEKYDITLFVVKPVLDLYDKVPSGIRVIVGKELRHNYNALNICILLLQKILLICGIKNVATRLKQINSEIMHKNKRKRLVRKYIKKETFDVVICNTLSNWSTEIACEISAKKRYLVYHGSNDTHREMLLTLLGNYLGVIAVSPEVKAKLTEWYPELLNRVCIIENLIEADNIQKLASEDTKIIERKENEVLICTCGRLSHEKGFDMAVDAASILSRKGYDFRWYFIGDGDERQLLEEQIKNLGIEDKICITGMQSNPFSIINRCDIYVQPSYEESYGRTIKEAMILGIPVVSTDTVGGRFLLNNGELGMLTSINAQDIARGIIEYLEDKDKIEKYANLYSSEQYEYESKSYESLWSQVLDS